MTASTPLCARACTIARNRSDRVSRSRLLRLTLSAAALLAPLGLSPYAAADECGNLKVAGYSARRTLGPVELQVFVSPEKERTDEVDAGPIRITDFRTMATTIMNPKNKSALVAPPPPKPPEQNDKNDVGRFFDREPAKDGLVTISMGVNTPNGKEWMVQTTCRPDGIWVDRKVKTPKGLLTMRQRDIKIEAIPAAQFEVPSDYKIIQPPPPPPAGKN